MSIELNLLGYFYVSILYSESHLFLKDIEYNNFAIKNNLIIYY